MSEITEMLERYRRGPEVIATLMTGAAGTELDFKPAPDKWSLRQILAHLADSEIVAADRFRRIIAEDNPTLVNFDQDAWAANLNYGKRKSSDSMDLFRRVHTDSYELLRDLAPETYERKGSHSVAGSMSLFQLLERNVVHVESHARQIRGVRDAYKQARQARAAT